MLVLRATQKVLKTLPRLECEGDTSDTALGDWYVNRFVVDRQPLLLVVSSHSLLAMLTPARDVKNLPNRMGAIVQQRLERIGIDPAVIGKDIATMDTVRVCPTRS